jgi:hypothetical protein
MLEDVAHFVGDRRPGLHQDVLGLNDLVVALPAVE